MIMRIVKSIIFIPVAIILIVLSVANRHSVTLALNPFRPEDQVMALSLPLFVFLFLALMIGIVIGSMATWWAQGRHRKRARNEAHEARKWHEEADRQRDRVEELNTRQLIANSR